MILSMYATVMNILMMTKDFLQNIGHDLSVYDMARVMLCIQKRPKIGPNASKPSITR